jgi:hypothetical protein
LNFGKDFLFEELLGGLGRQGIQLVIQSDVDAVDAVAHAEGAAQLYLVLQVVFLDQVLKLFHDLAGTLKMAGAPNANSTFHGFFLLKECMIQIFRKSGRALLPGRARYSFLL